MGWKNFSARQKVVACTIGAIVSMSLFPPFRIKPCYTRDFVNAGYSLIFDPPRLVGYCNPVGEVNVALLVTQVGIALVVGVLALHFFASKS